MMKKENRNLPFNAKKFKLKAKKKNYLNQIWLDCTEKSLQNKI